MITQHFIFPQIWYMYLQAPQIKIKASDGTRFPVQNPRLLEKDCPKVLNKNMPIEMEKDTPLNIINEHHEGPAVVKIKPTTLDLVTQFNQLEGQTYANELEGGGEAFGVVYDVFYKDVPLESYETTLELASGGNTGKACLKIHANLLEPSERKKDTLFKIIALNSHDLECNAAKDSMVDGNMSSSLLQGDTHDDGLLKVDASSYEGGVEEIQEDLVTNTNFCQMDENNNWPNSTNFSILSNMDHEEDDSTNSRNSFQVLLTHQERIIRPLSAVRRTSRSIASGIAQNSYCC